MKKRYGGLIATTVLASAAGLLWWQKWNIYDAYRLRNYSASPQIAQLASDTTMTDRSRRLFYVYHPELNDKTAFNANCNNNEKTIVLGCYVPGLGIYLYNVTDPRLQGIVQVTSAHEMLHAAYGRLSKSDKIHVNELIDQTYAHLTNERITKIVDDYKKNGADTVNELHSILATEVQNLPPELEQYYGRYFTNRKQIASYSERYEAAFSDRKTQADQYLAQMEALKEQINQLNANLLPERAQLEKQFASLQARRSQTKDAASFNAAVDQYNDQVSAYNTKVQRTASLIDQHNSILEKYNAIALEEKELVQAIDSRPATIDGQ